MSVFLKNFKSSYGNLLRATSATTATPFNSVALVAKNKTAKSATHTKPVALVAVVARSTFQKSDFQKRDYGQLKQWPDNEKSKCPACQNIDIYTFCPECWFTKGKYIPTTKN
ncbi:MAG TPA: hypothetical protein DD381_06995 [Lentisphaeria bacterium]|nr:MAG: hypothetical protein A2X47_10910 [Lentisphaerae bacterium GWF2_38_69]HBM16070.1 hypothetical protein [Lentisphaeria bacterium]